VIYPYFTAMEGNQRKQLFIILFLSGIKLYLSGVKLYLSGVILPVYETKDYF
jgi:hypothetical protein